MLVVASRVTARQSELSHSFHPMPAQSHSHPKLAVRPRQVAGFGERRGSCPKQARRCDQEVGRPRPVPCCNSWSCLMALARNNYNPQHTEDLLLRRRFHPKQTCRRCDKEARNLGYHGLFLLGQVESTAARAKPGWSALRPSQGSPIGQHRCLVALAGIPTSFDSGNCRSKQADLPKRGAC